MRFSGGSLQPRLMNKFQTSKPSARDWRSLTTVLHPFSTDEQSTQLALYCRQAALQLLIDLFAVCALLTLVQCLYHLLSIDEAVSHLSDNLTLIQSFHHAVRTQLSNLLRSITAILDLHTDHPTHLSIQHDVDTHLDTLKHRRAQLPFLLAQLVEEDADYGGELQGLDFVYVYMQQVGFLVRMSAGQRWEKGDWLFEDGEYDFYKSERTRQLDDG